MKNTKIFIFLILAFCFSCNNSKEEIIEIIEPLPLGNINGYVRLANEYGLHPFGEEEAVTLSLTNSLGKAITFETSVDDQKFEFDSLQLGKYYLEVESPTFKTCEVFEYYISNDQLIHEELIDLKSTKFTTKLNSFDADSLVGNALFHSFDIDKDPNKTLGVRLYLSDNSNVTNQDYKETVMNLAAWASPETSGQFHLALDITPELYEGDSIYMSVYLVSTKADECIGDNGQIYHYPFSPEYLTIGFKK